MVAASGSMVAGLGLSNLSSFISNICSSASVQGFSFYQFCNNFVEYFLVFSSSYLYTSNFPVFQYDYDVVLYRNVISY